MENNRSYFLRRAEQERLAASHSADSNARQAHLAMAQRYEDLAGLAEGPHAAL